MGEVLWCSGRWKVYMGDYDGYMDEMDFGG